MSLGIIFILSYFISLDVCLNPSKSKIKGGIDLAEWGSGEDLEGVGKGETIIR